MESIKSESNKRPNEKEYKISLTTLILAILSTLPMITSIVGLAMMIGEIGKVNSLEEFRTTLFPFLFKNAGIMGVFLVLIMLNLYRENRNSNIIKNQKED